MTRSAFFAYFPEVTSPKDRRKLAKLLSPGAKYVVRDYVVAHPEEIGYLKRVEQLLQ